MAIPTDTQPVPDPEAAASLDQLIRARGLAEFVLFGVVGEGRELPNGSEDASGYALDSNGRVYFFWTGWDAARATETLRIWEEASPNASWAGDGEYLEARKKLGLQATI